MHRAIPALALLFAACTTGPAGPTVASLEQAKEKVHAMQPKADALAAVEGIAGPPTTQDDAGMSWFAKEGDSCRELRVQIMGDAVGNVTLKKSDCP
jgi:nicotinamide mononucleotide (NMN) deamidase PncC